MPLLSVSHLRRSFDDLVAVEDVSFEINEGESYGLLGPNGAGKTTSISMISGLLKRDSGEVLLDGEPLDVHTTKNKQNLGLVPQNVALYMDLTAIENLKFWGRLYELKGRDLKTRVDEVLELVGLTDRAGDRVSKYSGGMQRRLNIAAGLLHRPKLLILDEPTVGVDPQSRNAILENVESLKSQGTAILYTTHYMEEAERLCDRVGIIDLGKIIAEGTRRELIESIGREDRVLVSAEGDLEGFARRCRDIPTVANATVTETSVELLTKQGRTLIPEIVQAAQQAGAKIGSVETFEPDLEAVFLHLTGKALRD